MGGFGVLGGCVGKIAVGSALLADLSDDIFGSAEVYAGAFVGDVGFGVRESVLGVPLGSVGGIVGCGFAHGRGRTHGRGSTSGSAVDGPSADDGTFGLEAFVLSAFFEDVLEVFKESASVGVAVGGAFGERFVEDLLELGREKAFGAGFSEGRGWMAEVLFHDFDGAFGAPERGSACEDFVEDGTSGVEVGAVVDAGVDDDLFGGHVVGCTDDHTSGGEFSFVGVFEKSDAEVEDFEFAVDEGVVLVG